MHDTDEKLEAVKKDLNCRIDDRMASSERRITDLYRQNRADFADLRSIIKECSGRIADTQLEVAQINVRIDGLATKSQLIETVGQIHEWATSQMVAHCMDKHKSKPAAKRNSLLPPDNNKLYKLLGRIAAGLAVLAAAAWALIENLR